MNAAMNHDQLAAARQQLRRSNEQEFDAMVRAYILNENRTYAYGGIINLLSTVRVAIEKIAENADYHGLDPAALQFAAEQIEKIEGECDIRYSVQLS
jgi:hypothetical protein